MNVANVTLHHDFCEASTASRIREVIRGPGAVLFYCSPCTGGPNSNMLTEPCIPMEVIRITTNF
eukprot:4835709-Lingulodinium_polyedra.AAC.1